MVLMTKSQRMLDHVDCRNVFRWKTAVGSIRDLSVDRQAIRRKKSHVLRELSLETRVCVCVIKQKKFYVC